ncbi:saccharopine dehydrogenase family protein, partial [Vibrio parahaemolyticus VPTS-2010]
LWLAQSVLNGARRSAFNERVYPCETY